MKTLKETMKPYGGLAALKFFFKEQGVELATANFQAFDRQAIPLKYAFAVEEIQKKRGVDLTKYLRQDKRVNNSVGTAKIIYPLTLKKMKEYGIGKIASHINEERNKNDIFKNPPARFNHHSMRAILSKKLTPKMKEFLVTCYELEKEIEADELAQQSKKPNESELLG